MIRNIAVWIVLGACAVAQSVTAPYVQSFDGVAGQPATLVASVGASPLGAAWDVDYDDVGSRVRIANPGVQLGLAGFVAASVPGNTGACAIFDRVAGQTTVTTQSLVLHINYAASNAGQGITVYFFLRESNDETSANDVIAVQDGVTTGDGITRSNVSTGLPGYDGFKEALLLDWNNGGFGGTWAEFAYTIDDAFLLANFGPGSTSTNDLRIIFRQQDNFNLEGGDGLLIDHVRVHAVGLGQGQVPQPGAAVLEIGAAYDVAGFPVSSNRPGPYRAAIPNGLGTFNFTVSGAGLMPIVLLFGQENPAVTNLPGIGQLDIGVPNPLPPFLPTGIVIAADGTQPGLFNNLFVTNVAGVMNFSFGTPVFPSLGIFGTFQAAVLTGGPSVVALSNAITIEII